MSKESKLEKLREEYEHHFAELSPTETQIVVHGEGVLQPRLLLIGEAPGEQESLLRRPFVGKAGKNLDAFLESVRIERAALYVTNVVKIRPTAINPDTGRVRNRPPSAEEVALWSPWLQKEIALIECEWIVTLGNVPLKALLGKKATVGEYHGRLTDWEGRKLFPLYHPASVLYNPLLKETYAADVRALAALLEQA